VPLYDVTSTYFEGRANGNELAKRGYSRDHRPDCKQVCVALVVSFDGFPLGYEVFAGNTHDSTTLQQIVETMEHRHSAVGRVWIADRGMASAKNLAWLRSTGRLLQRNSRAAARFETSLQDDDSAAGFALRVKHSTEFDRWAAISEGAYVLRSNITDWTDEKLWKAYIQLTQAEAAFRINACGRSGISAPIASRPIFSCASSPSCCGRPWRCGSSAPVLEIHPARCSKNSHVFNLTTSSCRCKPKERSACAA
jgi:DDE family transposase